MVIVAGCLVLLGWTLNSETLKSFFPGLTTMNPTTAIAFILAGVSLWLLRAEQADRRRLRIAHGCAFAVALVGLLKLIGVLFGWDLGIDQLLFREKLAVGYQLPNRMAPSAALNFLLVGSALLLLDRRIRRGFWPAQFLALAAAFASSLPIVGYAYGIESFYGGTASYIPMALPTALTFVVLVVGLLCVRPERGLMAIVTSDSAGGIMARRLLPAAILIPAVLGWLRLEGEWAGLYETELGVALSVVASMVVFAVLVWWNARLLYRTDVERQRAEEALRRSELRYRAIVEDQTELICRYLPDKTLTFVNDAYCRYFGKQRDELVGLNFMELIPEEDRAGYEEHFSHLSREKPVRTVEHRVVTPEGEIRWQQWIDRAIFDERNRLVEYQSVGRDVTEQRQAEEESSLLRTIALEVGKAEDLDSALRVTLQRVCEVTGWVIGQAWVPKADGTVLECNPAWYAKTNSLIDFRTTNEGLVFARGEGLPGHIWVTKRPVWIKDITQSNFTRARIAAESGLRAAMDIPVLAGSEVVAVLDFFVFEQREKDERLVELVSGVAVQLGSVIQRKRAEEALRKSEARHRAIVDTASDAIITMFEDGIIRSFNPAAERIFGYTAEEVTGRPLIMLMPERFRGLHEAGFRRYLETNETRIVGKGPVELAGLRKDGEEFPLELSLGEMREEDDILFTGIIRDVTERKRAEEALRESEQRFKSSFEDASIGMALVGTDGRWLQVNQSLCQIVGYSEQELLNKAFQDITHPDDLETDLGYVRQLLAGKIRTYQMEKRYFHKKGHAVWILLNVSLVCDAEGSALYFISQIQNVTERKRAEEGIRRLNETLEERVAKRTAQLIKSERRLKELVGKLVAAQEEERRRVAYEIHDGLTQVATAAHQHLQAFADDHPAGSTVGEGELDRPMELAQRTVKEARLIIEDLRPTALDDFGLATAVRLRVEELKNEGWEIGYEEALGEERLSTEVETAIYRVAQEALTNVRKHARTTRAGVSLGCRERKVRLEVRDEGRGFDPSATSGGNGPGERVGLCGMRERVALLGGELKITSEPGAGTTLVAEVPLPAAPSQRKEADHAG